MSNDIAVSAPAPTLSSAMVRAVLELTAPAPTLAATLSAFGFSGAVRAPAPSLAATGLTGEILSAALVAPAPALEVVSTVVPPMRAALTAPAARLLATLLPGGILTSALSAPAPVLAATGFIEYTGIAALVAPAPRLSASIITPVTSAYRTWVLNTRKLALTEYGPEFAFNSFAVLDGAVLACGPAGVVVLGLQSDDDGDAISARGRTGADSLNVSYLKRVPRLYASYQSDGDMLFRTITKENGTRTYALPFNGISDLQQRRVPIGKGPKSRYWQFEFENVDGSDFSINDILAYPIVLGRRVQ